MVGNYGTPVGEMFTTRLKVHTTPQRLATNVNSRPRRARTTVEIYVPPSAVTANVYMGGRDVTPTTGIPIPSGTRRLIPVHNQGGATEIYLVSDEEVEIVMAEYIP